ncbi:hypothetical protein PRNP1_008019 [Phytophthora ramorum]
MESELTMDLESLMEYLVETVGPLFIVFDENSDWFSGKRVELTETIDDIENERVTPGRISRCCRLGWEGTQENAKLFTPPEIKHEIATVVFPLCDYVTYITEILGYLSPDINDVFLWMCLKRWSELFSESSEPKDKLPAFFKEGTIFGEYDSVHFSEDIAVLPRIRPGTRCDTLVYASLIDDAETAYAKHWLQLVREISGMLDGKDDESFCFKFRLQSRNI